MQEPAVWFTSGTTRLAGSVWRGVPGWQGPVAVLLHAGVADRRSWQGAAERLAAAGVATLVAYDRRGFGSSPRAEGSFRHLDDLVAVLDQLGDQLGEPLDQRPVWLVGSSMGGALALDLALTHPDRVDGLVLLAPAVSGSPDPEELDADTQRIADALDEANAAGDLEEVNRLEAWLWLDGPASPEGRVSGPPRDLFLDMNGIALAHETPEPAGGSGLDAWPRLAEVGAPAVVAWGDLDLPFLVDRCAVVGATLPRARTAVLTGTAHLPYLEQPDAVADLVADALTGR